MTIGLGMVGEAAADYGRHKSDEKTNKRKTLRLLDGSWQEIEWVDVKVGDIIKTEERQLFPADMLLLKSSEGEYG